jgi:hypothetical protein
MTATSNHNIAASEKNIIFPFQWSNICLDSFCGKEEEKKKKTNQKSPPKTKKKKKKTNF